MSNVTTVPLLTDLQGPWASLRLELVGPGAPGVAISLPDIYPFLSIVELKRRLWTFQKGDPRWAPERVFLGIRDAAKPDRIRPLEFYWPTAAEPTLADPTVAARAPSSLLVDDAGNRKPVQPTVVGTLLLENAIDSPTDTVTAICLAALATEPDALTPALFGGFYQLYFPWLTAPAQVLDAGLTTQSKADMEAYAITVPYLEDRTGRIGIVQSAIQRGVGGTAMMMTTMVRLRWLLPPNRSKPESLEKTFYGLTATPTIPFLRYFPAEGTAQGASPLLKLALLPDGNPVLADPVILTSYLNQPAPNRRTAVIVARVPVRSTQAAPGAAFTIHMFEDGRSDIVFEVPQRGATYIAAVAEEAQRLLREVMTAIGFAPTDEPRLEELFATYRWSHPSAKTASPLTSEILRRRVRALTPFLDSVALAADEMALAAFRWRAVSNYEAEAAQFAYITQMLERAEKEGPAPDPATARIAFLAELSGQFGITEDQAAILLERWMERKAEAVAPAPGPQAGQKAVPAHATGTRIAISGTHPEYAVEIQGASSVTELQRIVSVIGVLLGASGKDLAVTPPTKAVQMLTEIVSAKEEAQAGAATGGAASTALTPEEALAGVEEMDPAMADLLADLGFDYGGDAEAEEEAAEETAAPVVEPAAIVTAVTAGVPESKEEVEEECRANPWSAGEPALRPKADWYMARLKKEDIRMFGFKSTVTGRIKSYSKSCQRRDDRQPNIMTQAEYNRVLRCYDERVRFVNLPPRKPSDLPQDPAFNLKTKYTDDYYLTDPQTGKPIWSVYNYENKSFPGQRMYLMCAELWCERDNLPLLRSEFEGTEGRGFTKPENTCPFCAGRPFESLLTPVPGESVIVRLPKAATGKLHTFIGTITRNKHPDGYALPCCDTTPRLLRKYMLAAAKKELMWGKELEEDSDEEEAAGAAGGAAAGEALEEGRLAVEAVLEKAALAGVELPEEEEAHVDYKQRLRTIRGQYILAPDKALGAGKFGMLPPILDAFFGQNSSALVIPRGSTGRSFKEGATAFVRLGVDTRTKARGLNLFAGLAPLLGLKSAEETQRVFLGMRAAPAFESANYGTLLHEFAARPVPPSSNFDRALTEFAAEFGYPTDVESRPHVLRVFKAWSAFLAYLANPQEPKQLRHLEHMLAEPGVVPQIDTLGKLDTGLLLVVLEEHDGKIQIACPSFGIPPGSNFQDVPISFLWHDRRDDSWEPLILYNDSATAGTQNAILRFGETSPEIVGLPKEMRAQLSAWIREWRSFSKGCGREKPPPHVWTPDRKTAGLPRLRDLLFSRAAAKLVRDRSNRLVGVLNTDGFFIPCLDDGNLAQSTPRVYEATGIPPRPLADYLKLYDTLGKYLKPTHVVAKISDKTMLVGFQTAIGTFVPTAPEPLGATAPALPVQQVDEFPWERDAHILRAPDAPTLAVTAMEESLAPIDEQLAEAYQHLRLSFGRWLQSAQGPAIQRSIERIVTSSLPLYERRKRMDILLEPYIRTMVEATPAAATDRKALSLLRQDCLALPETDCAAAGACRWSGGRCLIHAPAVAPADPIRIFTARLSDEVLRYATRRNELFEDAVPEIRTPRGVVRIGNELYMATRHKEAAVSILERLGFTGTMEMRFPEEMLRFDGLEEAAEEIQAATVAAGGVPQIPDYADDRLPASWVAAGFQLPSPPPDLPDPRATTFFSVTGKDSAKWTSLISHYTARKSKGPFNFSKMDMYFLSRTMKWNILFIRGGRIQTWIRPVEEQPKPFYLVFWGPMELLLSNNRTEGPYYFKYSELPPDLQKVFDVTIPAEKAELFMDTGVPTAGGGAAAGAATGVSTA